ncbi:hypothetical protein L208DRAFT_1376695 [Tricholoma matsutake]|nr:hypothetical protein L208DRAFT_1376695 [Tricholoma matsutake 945]
MYLTGSIIGVMLTFAYIGIATANVVCDDGSRAISERSSLFNGIKVGTWSCSTNSTPSSSGSGATGGSSKMHILNLCSASCTTHCNEPNGTVPNLHDCRILANYYYATSGRFVIKKGRYIIWAYDICKCKARSPLFIGAGVVSHVAFHCHWAEHSMAGSCQFRVDLFCVALVTLKSSGWQPTSLSTLLDP